MKKIICKLLAGLTATVATVGLVACGDNLNPPKTGEEDVHASLYTPDGAPALAIANMIAGDTETDYHVVAPATISTYVTGENPKADLCVLPVTAASKLLGSGEKYTMLATVTHGNLYLLSTQERQYETAEELGRFAGKDIGIFETNNVPGLTFQYILKGAELSYKIEDKAVNKGDMSAIYLREMESAAAITPGLNYDAYLAAEPVASLKVKQTASSNQPLHIVADLQKLYGGENGYPQAILVVKNEFLSKHEDWVKAFASRMQTSIASLNAATDVAPIISALNGVRTEGLTPAINANNLTTEVIARCNVKFVSAADSKAAVNAYLANVKTVKTDAVGTIADKFFYAN